MCSSEILKSLKVSSISMEAFEDIFKDSGQKLDWNCLFVLPFFLKIWWQIFGAGKKQMILKIASGSSLIGIAPVMLDKDTATFLGSESVCDYQDMIIADNRAGEFFETLLKHLAEKNVRRLELGAMRPDSVTFSILPEIAEKMGFSQACEPLESFYELKLPGTWEAYLDHLNGKQRHEVRRKIRRLSEAGEIDYHVFDNKGTIDDIFKNFLDLFQTSRKDKEQFLTDPMKSFFCMLAKEMAERNMLRLGFLAINGKNAASTFCFEYRKTIYLYNNGYHPEFSSLSIGTLCKVFSIRHSIEQKMDCYDFLKGDEAYKERLGGRPVPLYSIKIDLN